MPNSTFTDQVKRTPFLHRIGEWVGGTFRRRPKPLTVFQTGKMGRDSQRPTAQQAKDAMSAQLRLENAISAARRVHLQSQQEVSQ